MILRSKSMAQGARLAWDHEARFESDVFNRGVFNQLEDGQAHNLEAAGSNPAPATLSKK